MKVLVDTNVILDVIIKREPHFEFSAAFLKLCNVKITGCIIASQTTDIYYILSRSGIDKFSAVNILKKLTKNMKVLNINAADVQNALNSSIADYEDSLLACCAKRQKAEYIITRNEKDFHQSPVSAISPQSLLEQIFSA